MIQPMNRNIQSADVKTYAKNSKVSNHDDKIKKNENTNTLGEDTFERSEPKEELTYSKPIINKKSKSVSSEEVNKLIEENKQKQEDFKKFIRGLIAEQGDEYNLVLFNQKLNVSPEIAKKAEESISDGGEYSVDAVAGRILNMAKALSQGDSSKIDELKEGFLKGFKEAEKAWGGELPEISKKTYDEVLKRFDEWKSQESN